MDLIKTTPAECDCPVSAEYLKRHGVSMMTLDSWMIEAQTKFGSLPLAWVEVAEVADHIALHWNCRDGKMTRDSYMAVVQDALKRLIARKTTQIISKKVRKALTMEDVALADRPDQSVQYRPTDEDPSAA